MADTAALTIILTGHQLSAIHFSSMHCCKYSSFWFAEGAHPKEGR